MIPNRRQARPMSFRRLWITIALNLSLLVVLLFVIKPMVMTFSPAPDQYNPIHFAEGMARIPRTTITVPIAKSPGSTRVLFVGRLPFKNVSSAPTSILLAHAASFLQGKTLDFQNLNSPDFDLNAVADVVALCPRLSPDLVVVMPDAEAPIRSKADAQSLRTGAALKLNAPEIGISEAVEKFRAAVEILRSAGVRFVFVFAQDSQAGGRPGDLQSLSPKDLEPFGLDRKDIYRFSGRGDPAGSDPIEAFAKWLADRLSLS
jgi:hypothetical protein